MQDKIILLISWNRPSAAQRPFILLDNYHYLHPWPYMAIKLRIKNGLPWQAFIVFFFLKCIFFNFELIHQTVY